MILPEIIDRRTYDRSFMSTNTVIEQNIDWGFLERYLAERDPHFARHWELLREARASLEENIIVSRGETGQTIASSFAERVERLRYQLLHEREEVLDGEDFRAAEMLDLLFARLSGQGDRTPRRAIQVVHDESVAAEAVAQLEACLDRQRPLEDVLASARRLTREHFAVSPTVHGGREQDQAGPNGSTGWRVLVYAPLYLSSYCVNYCLYCGFRFPEKVPRRWLTTEEALEQAQILTNRGMRHILLVAGDYPQKTDVEYYSEIIRAIRGQFPVSLAVEIAPQSTAGYAALVEAGIIGVTLYQETYDWQLYQHFHPRGPKSHYAWRLEGLERAAEAGVKRLGLGILLGLGDPLPDAKAMVRHAAYLKERFPDRRIAFSLPRIHEGPADFVIPHPVDDETLIRLYCGLRHAFPQAELVLSTREPPSLRDLLARTCITQISAASSTVPGGYRAGAEAVEDQDGGQFPVVDRRPVEEVVAMLRGAGHHVTWQVPEFAAVTK